MSELKMDKIICNWCTYSAIHCRRNVEHDTNSDYNFCSLHKHHFQVFFADKDPNSVCEVSKEVSVCPRTYKHLQTVLKEFKYDDTIVEVKTKGGISEEADVSEHEYIMLMSDDTRYYYQREDGSFPKKCNRTKDLKVVLKKICTNESVIKYNNMNLCESCFKKNKQVPLLSIVLKDDDL